MDDLDCTKALLALYEFLDGELTVETRQHISGHLDGCPHCFSVFDFEAELRLVVRSRVRTQVPPDLLQRIAETIEREAGGGASGLGRGCSLAPGAMPPSGLPPSGLPAPSRPPTGVRPTTGNPPLGRRNPGLPGLPGT